MKKLTAVLIAVFLFPASFALGGEHPALADSRPSLVNDDLAFAFHGDVPLQAQFLSEEEMVEAEGKVFAVPLLYFLPAIPPWVATTWTTVTTAATVYTVYQVVTPDPNTQQIERNNAQIGKLQEKLQVSQQQIANLSELINALSDGEYGQLMQRIEGLEELIKNQQAEIERLKKENERLRNGDTDDTQPPPGRSGPEPGQQGTNYSYNNYNVNDINDQSRRRELPEPNTWSEDATDTHGHRSGNQGNSGNQGSGSGSSSGGGSEDVDLEDVHGK